MLHNNSETVKNDTHISTLFIGFRRLETGKMGREQRYREYLEGKDV